MTVRNGSVCGLLLLTCLLAALSAGAQDAPASKPDLKPASKPALTAAEAQAKLDTRVHLILGPTTLAQVTAAMSRQTGLDISGAEYLRERKLVVMLDDVRLTDALDALAEANDWSWRQDTLGTIVIARRLSRLRQTPASLPGLLRAAMPRDWRVFLGFPATESGSSPLLSPISLAKQPKVFAAYGAALNRLRASLDLEAVAQTPLTYKRMNPGQQQDIRLIMVCKNLWTTDTNLLYRPLMPHLVDPDAAILRFKAGNMFVAGSWILENGQDLEYTFGANLSDIIGDIKGGGQDGAKP